MVKHALGIIFPSLGSDWVCKFQCVEQYTYFCLGVWVEEIIFKNPYIIKGFGTQLKKRRGTYYGGSMVKNPPVMQETPAGDMGSIPGLEIPEEGNGNPFQYSCLDHEQEKPGRL